MFASWNAAATMRAPSPLTVVALGGLGEIGMNCLALEQGGLGDAPPERLVVDCGVTFPTSDDGVDLFHPRFDALFEGPHQLVGVVVTHGHEDHIGGLPYLLAHARAQRNTAGASHAPLVVWAPPYSLALCRERCAEHGFGADAVELRAIAPGERYEAGAFVFEPVRVAHSTVDAVGLVIETAAGTVVHTGDFKLEACPLDGEATDEARLRAAGDAGVALLLSDSTNVFSAGEAGGERDVADTLERIVARAPGRVVVGLFASNVHRLGALGDVAAKTGRKLCLLGRSLRRHADVARAVGRLGWPSDLVVAPEIAAKLPRAQLLYLATGTQAEARGALARLAAAQHPELRVGPGDLVVLSSRVIPGSERAVHAMCDDFLRLGAELRTRFTDPGIHVSGHAHRDEQRRMLELVRPRAFVPLHGTLHHLVEHAKLARDTGAESLVVVDGERVELGPTAANGEPRLRKLGPVCAGKVAVSSTGQRVDEATLRARRGLARTGAVFVALGIEPGLASGPPNIDVQISAHGVCDPEGVMRAAAGAARAAVVAARSGAVEDLVEAVRRAVWQRLGSAGQERPSVSVLVTSPDRALDSARRTP